MDGGSQRGGLDVDSGSGRTGAGGFWLQQQQQQQQQQQRRQQAAGAMAALRACCCSRTAAAVAITQLLSIALATTGVSSSALTRQGIHAPTFQSLLNYLLLAAVFGVTGLLVPALRARRRAGGKPAAGPDGEAGSGSVWRMWPAFLGFSVLDVYANFLVTKAYRWTSLTSVTLLDCATIPVVMLLSVALLRARYRRAHLVGAAACVAGLATLVLGDAGGGGAAGSRPWLGDALVLAGALLYACSNVAQELLLADVAPCQLLGMLGLFGAGIAGAQVLLLERGALRDLAWRSPAVAGPLAGFACALFCFYALVPQVLLLGGATTLNLGLLTSDVWAALARAAWFGGFTPRAAAFFGAALVLVAGGLGVFTAAGSPRAADDAAPGADYGRVRTSDVEHGGGDGDAALDWQQQQQHGPGGG